MHFLSSRFDLALALLLVPVLVPVAACSSGTGTNGAPADGGPIVAVDAGLDTVDAADAAPAPVPEPPWSGKTVEPGCTANGCIHSFARSAGYSKGVLTSVAAPGITVSNGVTEYLITYVSDGAEITGGIWVPDSAPPAGGFGVVVMNQFTTGLGASCTPSIGELGLGAASATALDGIVTIVPDATSYGKAPYGAYMEGPIAAHAALDAARAAFHTSEALGKPIARRAVIAGLSQGAYSTMAAATAYSTYANQLEIRGFVAAEPPSNLRAGTNATLSQGQTILVYEAMRLWSWQGLMSLSGGEIFKSPYDTKAPTWFANECIFNGSDGSDGSLYYEFDEPVPDGGTPSVPIPASEIFTQTFLDYAKNDSWPADWSAAFTRSQTVPSGLSLPVLVFEGTADTTVLPAAVDAYVAQLQAAGVNVEYRKIPAGTHATTALSSFTVSQVAGDQAVAWIKDKLAK